MHPEKSQEQEGHPKRRAAHSKKRVGALFVPRAVSLAIVASLFATSVAASEKLPRVVLIGDSITAGTVSGSPAPAYAQILENALRGEVEVVTLGCGGATTRFWHPKNGGWSCNSRPASPNIFQALVPGVLPARLVVVLLGTNDLIGFNAWGRVEPDKYRSNLRALIDALLAEGAQQVMLLVPPPNLSAAEAAGARLDAYRDVIRGLCGEPVLCGPDLGRALGARHFHEGNAHPNGRGHARIAELLESELREALPELRKNRSQRP